MKAPSNFMITPSTQEGDVYGTEFTFTSELPLKFSKFAWSFGDKSKIVYKKESTSHIYQYPGLYTVELSAWSDDGDFVVDSAYVNVDYVYRDSMNFTQIPGAYGYSGIKTKEPFVISLTSAKIDQPIYIDFHSHHSNSIPYYAVDEKWRFITPKWRFTDFEGNTIIDKVLVDTTPVYKNGRVVAVKADYKFFYIDDIFTGLDVVRDCPILLIARLNTENFSYPPESLIYPYASYSNNESVQAVGTWKILNTIPTNLKVTENFINDVYPVKWANVPIPVMITAESNSKKISAFANENLGYDFNIASLSYPLTNEQGGVYPVNIRLSSSEMALQRGVHYKTEDQPLYFRNTDEYGNIASGYIFTTITPLSTIPGNTVVIATTNVINDSSSGLIKAKGFGFPMGYPIFADAYMSHSLKNFIYMISLVPDIADCPVVKHYKDLGILSRGSTTVIATPSSSDTTGTDNYALPNTSGNVYAITFNPATNTLYSADIEFNTVSMYLAGTKLLTSVQLEHIFDKETLGPSCISVDKDNNVWVSLVDDRKILKFDSELRYILSAAPPEYLEPLRAGSWLEAKNPSFNPPIVETDKENKVWVCYPGHEAPSRLYKFDNMGNTLLSADMPENAFPVSLSIGADNSVWAACKSTDNVLSFNSDGTIETTVTGLLRPSYICHDKSGNICILHGYNLYSYYDIYSETLKTWEVDTKENRATQISDYTSQHIHDAYYSTEIWGGMSTDVYNRLWILDSESNKVVIALADQLSSLNIFSVNPQIVPPYARYVIKSGDTFTTKLTTENQEIAINLGLQRSLQAGGDWTGNRWYQKYGLDAGVTPVTGISTEFKVYDLDSSFNVAKINESWSYADYFKGLSFPENLNANESLHEFIAAAVGDGNPLNENLSSVIYEKIANFVSNHGDIDIANIDSLTNLAKQLGVDIKPQDYDLPATIKRLIDLFSIHKQKLRGVINYETDIEKTKSATTINGVGSQNILITADNYYLFESKRSEGKYVVYANRLNKEPVYIYPLSELEVNGLTQPLADNYYIYHCNFQTQSKETPFIDNVIDWTSKFTTFNYSLSSHEDWYGPNGIVEVMFNNLLTKQLYQT